MDDGWELLPLGHLHPNEIHGIAEGWWSGVSVWAIEEGHPPSRDLGAWVL